MYCTAAKLPFSHFEQKKIYFASIILRSRGFGFVCYENEADASKAMAEMNGCNIAGKEIYVGLAQRKQDRAALLAKEREVSNLFIYYV